MIPKDDKRNPSGLQGAYLRPVSLVTNISKMMPYGVCVCECVCVCALRVPLLWVVSRETK